MAVEVYKPSAVTVATTGTNSSSAIDVSQCTTGCVAITSSGMTGSATFIVERSLDGTNFDDFPGPQSFTTSSNECNITDTLDFSGITHVRARVTSANAAGSLSVRVVGKAEAR